MRRTLSRFTLAVVFAVLLLCRPASALRRHRVWRSFRRALPKKDVFDPKLTDVQAVVLDANCLPATHVLSKGNGYALLLLLSLLLLSLLLLLSSSLLLLLLLPMPLLLLLLLVVALLLLLLGLLLLLLLLWLSWLLSLLR